MSSGPSSRGDDTSASESDTTFTGTTIQSDTSGTCGNKDSSGNDDRSVRLSPDTASVNVGIDKITVVDKPSRLRSETRGQYMC